MDIFPETQAMKCYHPWLWDMSLLSWAVDPDTHKPVFYYFLDVGAFSGSVVLQTVKDEEDEACIISAKSLNKLLWEDSLGIDFQVQS